MRLKFWAIISCVSFVLLIHHTCWLATIIVVQAKSHHHHHHSYHGDDDHSKSHRSRNIWGSIPAHRERWKFMALLRIPQFNHRITYCSAILINNQSLLTAAHCFLNFTEEKPITLGLGPLSLEIFHKSKPRSISRRKTFSYIVYEKYPELQRQAFKRKAYDIAIIKLEKPIVLDPPRGIDRVDLPIGPDGRQYPFDPENCYLVAYGQEMPAYYSGHRLQEVKVPILPRDICKMFVYDMERQICFGYPREPSQVIAKACAAGDSGGGFLCKTIHFHSGKHFRLPRYCLIAINSCLSHGDDLQERFSVGVRITKYMDWIQQNS